MSNYWDNKFLQHLNIEEIGCIFEVGARYGDESINLSLIFENAKIFAFECNPKTIEICKNNLKNMTNIHFYSHGLGDKNEILPFYSYIRSNDGASSLLKRIDYEDTQVLSGFVNIKKITDVIEELKISHIDLLCMDIQGYEINVLEGCDDFIKKVKYIIMEEPKEIINTMYLPQNMHSKYIGAPDHIKIKNFMKKNNFIEIERIEENAIEDNVMYKNIMYL